MKKLMSILICVAMILSLIPAIAAAGDGTLEYVFTNSEQGGSGTVTPVKEAFHGWSVNEDKWQFVNMVNYSACALYDGHLNWGFSTTLGKPEYNGEDKMTGAYAIELEITETGTYTPTLNYRAVKEGAKAEVYLVEKEKFASGASGEYYFNPDITATKAGYDNEDNTARREAFISAVKAMSANDRLGTVNTYSTETADNQPKTFRDIEIEKEGSYILVIVPTGAEVENEKKTYNIQLHSFKLDKVVENTAVEREYRASDVYAFKAYNYGGGINTSYKSDGYVHFSTLQTRYYHQAVTSANGVFQVFRLNVQNPGEYKIQLKTNNPTNISAAPELYFVADDGTITGGSTVNKQTLIGQGDNAASSIGYFNFADAAVDTYGYITTVDGTVNTVSVTDAGNYFLVLAPNAQSRALSSNTDSGDLVEKGIINSLTGALLGSNVSANTYLQEYYLSGIKLVPVAGEHVNVETDEEKTMREEIQNEGGGNLSAEADKVPLTANINALTMFGDEVKKDTVTAGEKVTVTAPDKTGYTFLYWAKGLSDKKVIVSDKKSYTFTAVRENNPLIAVYTSDTADTKVEFYNGNFQLLDATLDEENKLPALPEEGIAGYGPATHWELFGDEKEYYPGDKISPSGNMIFVAQYKELEKNIKVTVNGEEEKHFYGDLVTVTAPARSGSDVFNYWLRDGQIVGFGKTYSFYAYEDCELTSVYKEYEPINKTLRKIILDTMDDGWLMAEFIGFGDAAEKGIMIGSKKIAMTSASSQFALYNDETGDVVGYAVDKDGNIYYENYTAEQE